MRVIDHKRQPVPEKKKRSHKTVIIALVLAIGVSGLYILLKPERTAAPAADNQQQNVQQDIVEQQKQGKLKKFIGAEFQELYENFAYPNTKQIDENTPITGNSAADTRIKKIALERGYKIRSAPVTNTFVDVGDGMLLQQRAAQPWLDLVKAAKEDGQNLGLTAAFRPADEQKDIFNQRLAVTGIPVAEIPSGNWDDEISIVLRTTAIPGYSRHHNGYTVDIACLDMPTTSFAFTPCFEWLSMNNYENAQTHGWIPSYPTGATNQGPEPEPWEYVWVGKDAVTE